MLHDRARLAADAPDRPLLTRQVLFVMPPMGGGLVYSLTRMLYFTSCLLDMAVKRGRC